MPADQGRCSGGPERLALEAAVVIDPRLADVWQVVWAGGANGEDAEEPAGCVPLETLGVLLRLAYLHGYADATAEPAQGALYAELGVREPPADVGARTRRGPARRSRRGRAGPGSSGR